MKNNHNHKLLKLILFIIFIVSMVDLAMSHAFVTYFIAALSVLALMLVLGEDAIRSRESLEKAQRDFANRKKRL